MIEEYKPRLVVLCDYGLDDAIATVNIFNHRQQFGFIDIVAIGGNFSAETSFQNATKLISNIAPDDDRVRVINTANVEQNSKALYFVHGNDGMGDLLDKCDGKVNWMYFDEYVSRLKPGYILLSLGPATLAKRLILAARPLKLVMMGGCCDGTPNFEGDEFNHGMDKEGFAFCCREPHACVMLDTACNALDIQQADIPCDSLYHRLMARYRDLCTQNGEKGCYVWDDVAVWYLLRPDLFDIVEKTDKYGNQINCLSYNGGNYLQIT